MIGSRISRASPKEAFSAVGGYALVLDMTVRDFQVVSQSGSISISFIETLLKLYV